MSTPAYNLKQSTLDTLLSKWQKRLRLLDWHISIDGAPVVANSASCYGCTEIKSTFREAAITIRSNLSGKDLEYTVVHELVHVVFAGVVPPAETAEDHLFETGVEALARILVDGQ